MRLESMVNITGLKKDGPPAEWYVVIWHDSQRDEALRHIGRWAVSEELSFSWADCAQVANNIRRTLREDGYAAA